MDETTPPAPRKAQASNWPSRRDILRVGGLGMLGLSLPQLIAAREQRPAAPPQSSTFGRAKNVIFLYLAGGPPQHETFDPKPQAPAEIRGEFSAIATNVPGIHFCELLPRTARVADKLAVVRSMATDDNTHSSSGAWVLSGHKYAGTNARTIQPTDWPYFGSIVKMLKPSETLPPLSTVWIPDWMRLNENVTPAGQTGGMIGKDWDPERFIGDPAAADYRVEGLQLTGESLRRLRSRKSLLEQLDRHLRRAETAEAVRSFDSYQQQAFDLLTSGKAVGAFQIHREAEAVRARYGMNTWGQSVLLARRLIEAGVRLVHVQWPRMPGDNAVDNPLWDTHAQNFDRLEDVLCPVFDVGFSALIEDLDAHGLFDETLVVAIGEFGRTPKINKKAGRDHWGAVFSCALAGAGISGGQAFGASDKFGAHPVQDRVEPGDLTATIFHLLGIDHQRMLYARDGRALPITHGRPIEKLLGLEPATRERMVAGGDPARVPPFEERLLVHNNFATGVDVRSFDGPSRPKGWRAAPVWGPSAAGLAVRIIEPELLPAPLAERHVAIGLAGNDSRDVVIEPSAGAVLAQEVRSPFAGTFVLTLHATATAVSAEFFEQVFLKHFTCKILVFEFAEAAKSPQHRKVLATVNFQPTLLDPGRPGISRFRLRKTFAPASPGQNISFGLGLGVAVVVEKTYPGTLELPADKRPHTAALHVVRVDLEFAGKERNEDVQV